MRAATLALLICPVLACLASGALASTVQEGTLRVSITTQIKPFRLPRTDPGPIDVFIAGHIASTTGGVPSQLTRMTIYVNRHGVLDTDAVPVCPVEEIRPATTAHALERCGPSLIGSGHFWASVVFAEQGAYHTTGRLLAFNGRSHGKPAVLAQIYTAQPFPSSFVVPFAITKIPKGRYGTRLSAELPAALGGMGIRRPDQDDLRPHRADGGGEGTQLPRRLLPGGPGRRRRHLPPGPGRLRLRRRPRGSTPRCRRRVGSGRD
jgi:hypothetical protein